MVEQERPDHVHEQVMARRDRSREPGEWIDYHLCHRSEWVRSGKDAVYLRFRLHEDVATECEAVAKRRRLKYLHGMQLRSPYLAGALNINHT